MSNNQSIQFLLKQLATNEQDRDGFNSLEHISGITVEIKSSVFSDGKPFLSFWTEVDNHSEVSSDGRFEYLSNPFKIQIIRTCLSRVNGQAILGVFEGGYTLGYTSYFSHIYYEAFDKPLRRGKLLDESVQALHDKMLELVPEYQTFLINNQSNV